MLMSYKTGNTLIQPYARLSISSLEQVANEGKVIENKVA